MKVSTSSCYFLPLYWLSIMQLVCVMWQSIILQMLIQLFLVASRLLSFKWAIDVVFKRQVDFLLTIAKVQCFFFQLIKCLFVYQFLSGFMIFHGTAFHISWVINQLASKNARQVVMLCRLSVLVCLSLICLFEL